MKMLNSVFSDTRSHKWIYRIWNNTKSHQFCETFLGNMFSKKIQDSTTERVELINECITFLLFFLQDYNTILPDDFHLDKILLDFLGTMTSPPSQQMLECSIVLLKKKKKLVFTESALTFIFNDSKTRSEFLSRLVIAGYDLSHVSDDFIKETLLSGQKESIHVLLQCEPLVGRVKVLCSQKLLHQLYLKVGPSMTHILEILSKKGIVLKEFNTKHLTETLVGNDVRGLHAITTGGGCSLKVLGDKPLIELAKRMITLPPSEGVRISCGMKKIRLNDNLQYVFLFPSSLDFQFSQLSSELLEIILDPKNDPVFVPCMEILERKSEELKNIPALQEPSKYTTLLELYIKAGYVPSASLLLKIGFSPKISSRTLESLMKEENIKMLNLLSDYQIHVQKVVTREFVKKTVEMNKATFFEELVNLGFVKESHVDQSFPIHVFSNAKMVSALFQAGFKPTSLDTTQKEEIVKIADTTLLDFLVAQQVSFADVDWAMVSKNWDDYESNDMAQWLSIQTQFCQPQQPFTLTTAYVQRLGDSLLKPSFVLQSPREAEEDYDVSLQDYGSENEQETVEEDETGEGSW
eukprot:TRINITY_DN8604_c0_g1_i1.p1 TRINITY_DN8604_c0_g1~~TRINITY_DN8604_c0_g1_i1.p1  ORF type:complete len:675 (+),score=149.43 TRINITY_DN8604_c0_g1_i1:292-2025(+)